MNSRRLMGGYPRPTDHGLGIAGLEWISGCASQQKAVPLVRDGSIATDESKSHDRACPLRLSKRTICTPSQQVRLVSKADILRCGRERRYSITSSARFSTDGGTVMPSAFAVLRLMSSSILPSLLDWQAAALSLGGRPVNHDPIVNRIRGIMPQSRFADGTATKTAPNHKSLSKMASTIAVTASGPKITC